MCTTSFLERCPEAHPVHFIIWPKLGIIFYVHSDVYMFFLLLLIAPNNIISFMFIASCPNYQLNCSSTEASELFVLNRNITYSKYVLQCLDAGSKKEQVLMSGILDTTEFIRVKVLK